VGYKPFEPFYFIVKFWPRVRIAIGKINAAYYLLVGDRFNIPAMGIIGVTGQATSYFPDLFPRMDGYSVPGFLPVPDGIVTRLFLARLQGNVHPKPSSPEDIPHPALLL